MFASQERIWADYEKTVIPLKSLSSVPALKARPVIIARVVSKSERRMSVNDEPYFVIFLSDGTLVKAQFYNEVAVNFYKLIQKGKLYEISNFTVRKYNNMEQLVFNLNSQFNPIDNDNGTIAPYPSVFCSIRNVFSYPVNSLVNIIAIVLHVGKVMEFQGGIKKRQIVKLMDTSSSTINFVLWDDNTSLIVPSDQNKTLVMYYAYVNIWKNQKELVYKDQTYFRFEPIRSPSTQW